LYLKRRRRKRDMNKRILLLFLIVSIVFIMVPISVFANDDNSEIDSKDVWCNLTYDGNGNTGGSPPFDDWSPYINGETVYVMENSHLYKTGYTFKCWNTKADGSGTDYTDIDSFTIHENTTLYAQWKIDTYSVYFNSNGGSTVGSQTIEYDGLVAEPTAPTKEGFSFAGWYSDEECTIAWDFENDTVTKSTTLYAKWVCTVTYDGNGNTGGSDPVDATTYTEGDMVTVLNEGTLEKTGYFFLGWSTEPDDSGEGYLVGDTFAITENMVLYAQWNKYLYDVTYYEGVHGSFSEDTSPMGEMVYYQESVTEVPTVIADDGYELDYWQENETGTHYTSAELEEISVESDMSFTAVYKKKSDVIEGNITLKLTDSNGNPLAYYPVELHSTVIKATTDANGQVTFTNVTFENHELVIFDKDGNELGTIYLYITESESNTTSVSGSDVYINFNESAVSLDIGISVGDDGSLVVRDIEINANPKTAGSAEIALFISEGNKQVNVTPYISIILTALLISGIFIFSKKKTA
jgi:uncharacterized repeat protein (TIGR02543 family)